MGSFKAKGLTEAIEATFMMGLNSHEVNMQVLESEAIEVVAEAVRIVPVRTGRLQTSIDVYDRGPDYVILGAGGLDGEAAPYAGFVEFGTSRMEARPYMQPALAKVRAQTPFRFRFAFERLSR